MKISVVNISNISIFLSFFLVFNKDFNKCIASQLQTQRVITSQIRSHIEY